MATASASANDSSRWLRRELRSWQIFFISVGGIIGIGFFTNCGVMLAVAGPGGTLLAVGLMGLVAMFVMEGICEMIVLWPIPNAMVEFVRTFVDEDLAMAIGISYWYTYTVTFSALILGAANLADYWTIPFAYKSIVFALAPIILWVLNCFRVEVFGWIETFGGILKLGLVLGACVLMIVVNVGAGHHSSIGSKYFVDGVQNNPNVAANHFEAVSIALPLATFAYLGVELLTMTAFEARYATDLKFTAKNIGWLMTVIYLITTLLFVFNVSWRDDSLPPFYSQGIVALPGNTTNQQSQPSHAPPIIALLEAGFHFLPGLLNGCLIYSAMSAANTGLYTASRALFGLTRTISVDASASKIRRAMRRFGAIEPRTGSPWPALFISASILYWLPFVHLDIAGGKEELQEILGNIGSVSGIIVWCSQCVAYIRFYEFRAIHELDGRLEGPYAKYRKDWRASHGAILQPLWAYLGAASTGTVVVFFNCVSLWNRKSLTVKTISAYLSPLIIFLMYLTFKLRKPRSRRRWKPVDLRRWADFEEALKRLEDMIRPPERIELRGVLHVSPSSTGAESRPADSYDPGDMVALTNGDGNGNANVDSGNGAWRTVGHMNGGPVPPIPSAYRNMDMNVNMNMTETPSVRVDGYD